MNRSLRQIFARPAAIAAASAVGLVSALVGDGPWDALSWLTLGLAVVGCAWYGLPWRPRRKCRGVAEAMPVTFRPAQNASSDPHATREGP